LPDIRQGHKYIQFNLRQNDVCNDQRNTMIQKYLIIALGFLIIGTSCASYNTGSSASAARCDSAEENVKVNPARVPESLRDLLPFAMKWGITDQAARDEMKGIISADQYRLLGEALYGRVAAVEQWLESASRGSAWSDEACLFRNLLEFYNDVTEIQLLNKLKGTSKN
jgi:hypothetical protein